MKNSLSLVVMTLNEEKNIERCLASVSFATEKLVIDSGSSDRTVEIAQKAGAKCLMEPWRGFGRQRQFATEQAAHDWILFLDADEALSPELAKEIEQLLPDLDPSTAYEMPRKSWHMGRWIRHGGWYPDWQRRLYNRKLAKWSQDEIHEKIHASKTQRLTQPILHWVFRDLRHQVETNNRYSTEQAMTLFKQNKKFSIFKLVTKPYVKFIECYYWKLGFLDGLPGFVIAVGAAYSVFIRWSKLWEMERDLTATKK